MNQLFIGRPCPERQGPPINIEIAEGVSCFFCSPVLKLPACLSPYLMWITRHPRFSCAPVIYAGFLHEAELFGAVINQKAIVET